MFKIIIFIYFLSSSFTQSIPIVDDLKADIDGSVLSKKESNIVYDIADITTLNLENNNMVQLEAFKSSLNDVILSKQNTSEYGKLIWVSLGNPTLIRTPNIRNKSISNIFHFSTEGFYTYVEMLTKIQRQILLKTIKNKYQVDISIDQLVNLVLSRFQCKLNLFSSGIKMMLIGEVTEFQTFPLRMNFWAPINSKERLAFQQRLLENDLEEHADLHLGCEIASRGKELKTNKLIISVNQLNQLDVTEKLFGPANTTHVTRDQLNNLANELYTSLNIAEEYQMPMYQFSEEFVQDIISQTASIAFNQIAFDDVIKGLSKYSRSIDDDLEHDVLKFDFGRIFEINKSNNLSFIQINNENFEALKKICKIVGSVAGNAKFLGIIKIGGSIKVSQEKSKEWIKAEKTLNEQIREINTENENDIQWKIDGDLIVPKSINVARLNRASFSKALTFNRIRKQYYDALFQRKLSLYTSKYTNKPLISQLPVGTILSVSSISILDGFNQDGKGIGDYLGWYLCDGRNGAPDLSRKFLVGHDNKLEDTFSLGNTGGLSFVTLNVDKLPIYTINLEGLQNINDLDMHKAKISYSGDSNLYENRPSYYVVTYIVYLDLF
jgi:hypothetical protein